MDFMKEYEKWLASPALSGAERAELESIRNDPKEIESRFYGPLEFGTAGLRGIMAVGLHNMNIHVIRWATQGFAQVICAEGEEGKRRGVAICMDCRNHSMEFARAAAEVCAANGIHVRIFESLRPTPELSFAVRYYGCQAGINVTASHNPKEYNGYKVYWADGAQLPPQHAAAIHKPLHDDGALFVIQLYAGGIDLFLRDNQLVFQLLVLFFQAVNHTVALRHFLLHFSGALVPGAVDVVQLVSQGFHLIFQIRHAGAQAGLGAQLFQRDPGSTTGTVANLTVIGVRVGL